LVSDTSATVVVAGDEQLNAVEQWAEENRIGAAQALAPTEAEVETPQARPLSELVRPALADPNELLKYRYLCRGGGLLLVGPTGIGKSSLSLQLMVSWALGREAFGIQPSKPLKSLLIQAENDDGDLAEMRDGVKLGLRLREEEGQQACANIIVCREDSLMSEEFFTKRVIPLLEQHRPDLLWIDPALAYLGGETNSQKDVGRFLRNQLNPVLHSFGCGCVVVHHTNKPPSGQEKANWQAGDFAYLGSGSAEWANWARAAVVMRAVGSHSLFELRAGKRGSRLGWREADGETRAYAKYIAHAEQPGVICWREASEEEVPAGANGVKRQMTKEDVMPHVPVEKAITKEALRSKANQAGIALNRINGMIAELVDEGRLFEWRVRRKGTNEQRQIARFAQPEPELLK
jgi:hypothetical protein